MPNIKSAKKRVLTSKRKCGENTLVESRMKNSIKKLEKTNKESNKKESEKALKVKLKNIDKDQNIGLVHNKNAAKKKSRLTKMLNNMNK